MNEKYVIGGERTPHGVDLRRIQAGVENLRGAHDDEMAQTRVP